MAYPSMSIRCSGLWLEAKPALPDWLQGVATCIDKGRPDFVKLYGIANATCNSFLELR